MMSGLFGSTILEVAIGLIFIYFLLSLICSSINESIASLFKWRAKDLERALYNLLCDENLAQNVLKHPLIKGLGNNKSETAVVRRLSGEENEQVASEPGKKAAGKPSYIPSRAFALALFDSLAPASGNNTISIDQVRSEAARLATTGNEAENSIGKALLSLIDVGQDPRKVLLTIGDVQAVIQNRPDLTDAEKALLNSATSLDGIRKLALQLPSGAAQTAILSFIDKGQQDLDIARKNVETWFDDAMERLSGVYKRRIRLYLLFIALGLSLLLGADTFRFINSLANNPTLRSVVVAEAQRVVDANGDITVPLTSTFAISSTSTITTTTIPTTTAGALIPGTTTVTTTQTLTPSISSVVDELNKLGLPFGYDDRPKNLDGWDTFLWWLRKFLGILITTFALTLGAPFWFDQLKKLSNIRGAGTPPAAKAGKPRAEPNT